MSTAAATGYSGSVARLLSVAPTTGLTSAAMPNRIVMDTAAKMTSSTSRMNRIRSLCPLVSSLARRSPSIERTFSRATTGVTIE
jgi:hypothetical protein